MAVNERNLKIQSLTTNTVALGGVATLGVDLAPVLDIESALEGAVTGPEDHDYAIWAGNVRYEGSDISKLIALLISTPGDSIFQMKQSGVSGVNAWAKHTLATTVWHGGSIAIRDDAMAALSMQGALQYALTTTDLEGVIVLLKDQTVLANITPARYFRLRTLNFTSYATLSRNIDILHAKAFQFGLVGNVLRDFGDADLGETAVDIAGYQVPTVSITFRDASEGLDTPAPDLSGTERAVDLIRAGRGLLTGTVVGAGGRDNANFRVHNVAFGNYSVNHGEGYSDYTLTGKAPWYRHDPVTPVVYALETAGAIQAIFELPYTP